MRCKSRTPDSPNLDPLGELAMPDHQIVIISGKTCSGKTGLANLLHERYGFRVVSTRVVLGGKLELGAGAGARPSLIRRARARDKATKSGWVVEAIQSIIGTLKEGQGIVVDHVSSPKQVEKCR